MPVQDHHHIPIDAARRFEAHTLDTAPEPARATMRAISAGFGYLPVGVGLMSESPELLSAFTVVHKHFENSTLDQLEREVVALTVATRNGCHLCVALHTATLLRVGAPTELVAALREQRVLPDPRLDSVRRFTIAVMETTGAVSDAELSAFLDAGHTRRNALEIVLGVGAYTLATLANRLTGAPVDPPLREFVWTATA